MFIVLCKKEARMGKKEEPMIAYYDDPEHFADLINGWLYHGKKEITSAQIETSNVRYTAKSRKKKKQYRTRYRDIVKKIRNMKVFLILGTEIQSYIDYAMPVRVMDYNTVEYMEQISRIRSKNKSAYRRGTGRFRLSAVGKEDRLIPVITLVLYIGEKPWDAANSLHELLDMTQVPPEWETYIQNYRIQVLDICHTADERLLEFPEDIACMFLLIKYAKNQKILKQLVQQIQAFRKMDEETYDVVWNYIQDPKMLEAKELLKNEEGDIDMGNFYEETRNAGKIEGLTEGKTGEIRIIRRILAKPMTPDAAAELLELPEKYVLQINDLFQHYPKENDEQIAARLLGIPVDAI